MYADVAQYQSLSCKKGLGDLQKAKLSEATETEWFLMDTKEQVFTGYYKKFGMVRIGRAPDS
jgi:hypothetical protein